MFMLIVISASVLKTAQNRPLQLQVLQNYVYLTVGQHEFCHVNTTALTSAQFLFQKYYNLNRWQAEQRNAETDQFAKMWSSRRSVDFRYSSLQVEK